MEETNTLNVEVLLKSVMMFQEMASRLCSPVDKLRTLWYISNKLRSSHLVPGSPRSLQDEDLPKEPSL